MSASLSSCVALASLAVAVGAPQNVLWLPLGDSITFGCTGPTIQDCHADGGGYRVPLAFALTQPALGDPANEGFNISTMGTDTTGPPYVPAQWLKHCGFPGWTIPMIKNFLPQAFASNPARPDIITIHLGSKLDSDNSGVATTVCPHLRLTSTYAPISLPQRTTATAGTRSRR
jgi:hypothetical protein